ncbi:type II toxin-antitoxin system HicB family antitoxin [Chloroflexota bacterium]
MTLRFAIAVGFDEHGRPIGAVPALDDCVATGRDMEEMLDRLQEEVRVYLVSAGQLNDDDIELVGYDVWAM